MKEISFLALEPPGNIAQPYYVLQKTLFRSFGMTTARLFPPIIPVAALSEHAGGKTSSGGQASSPAGGAVARLRSALERTAHMRSIGCVRTDGKTVYVPVDTVPAGLFRKYDPLSIFFPKEPGILLGLRETIDISDAELSALDPLPVKSWHVVYLTEIRITYSGSETCFETAEWEYLRYEKTVCRGSA